MEVGEGRTLVGLLGGAGGSALDGVGDRVGCVPGIQVSQVLCWIRLGKQVVLSLLNCVHCDVWIVLKIVFV